MLGILGFGHLKPSKIGTQSNSSGIRPKLQSCAVPAPATSSKEESSSVKIGGDSLFYSGILQSYPVFSPKLTSVCFWFKASVVLHTDTVPTSDIRA
jgi:hypothetical protein